MDDDTQPVTRRFSRGDRDAAETLYRRSAGRLWRYAWMQTRSREMAADIVQDTFLCALRGAAGFAGRSSAETWLFAIARNVTIEFLRRRQRQAREAEPAVLQLRIAEADPDELERDERRNALRSAVSELRPAQRDAVVLFELCGLSIRETAEVLGWKEGRVRTTLHRARQSLRDTLRGQFQDEAVTRKRRS